MSTSKDATQMLVRWTDGRQEALEELLPLVYDQLRSIADRYLRRERPDHTLQATALVHEVYLRLIAQEQTTWQTRAQFIGIAARAMREILVTYAIHHKRVKRGGGAYRLSLDAAADWSYEPDVDLLALDEALHRLATLDPPQKGTPSGRKWDRHLACPKPAGSL